MNSMNAAPLPEDGEPEVPDMSAAAETLAEVTTSLDEAAPATEDDYNNTYVALSKIVDSRGEKMTDHLGRHTEAVVATPWMRREGATEDDPRIQIVKDPRGELEKATSLNGSPALIVNIEQGKPGSVSEKSGDGWAVSAALYDRGEGNLSARVEGHRAEAGRNSRIEGLPGHGSMTLSKPSGELTAWMRDQVARPDTLEPIPDPSSRQRAGSFIRA